MAEYRNIYFIGIGGIGMSAIARYYNARGFKVSGYDKTPSPLTHALEQEGIEVITKTTAASYRRTRNRHS
jgi:UDP-N-acetylmuramate--alanine ligase